ncbi:PepSY domain-containing protein [Aeromicrobium sp. CF4.19]|uniref:PepSY domain-containing protein n=1 Tax=Aeromicrobium sp. CF4.19 TaxID=3373082 RepID=UPI003EE6A7B3
MKTPSRETLTSKRVLLPAGVLAGVLVLSGGAVAAGALDGNDDLTGNDLDRASSAALDEVGGGKVVSAEVSDDKGVAYELEIRTSDGGETDVALDESYNIVRTDTDHDEGDEGDRDNGPDADDRRLTDAEWTSIEKAALEEAGGGTLTDAEASDDRGAAYEAEVRLDGRSTIDIRLDSDFGVVDSRKDDAD